MTQSWKPEYGFWLWKGKSGPIIYMALLSIILTVARLGFLEPKLRAFRPGGSRCPKKFADLEEASVGLQGPFKEHITIRIQQNGMLVYTTMHVYIYIYTYVYIVWSIWYMVYGTWYINILI